MYAPSFTCGVLLVASQVLQKQLHSTINSTLQSSTHQLTFYFLQRGPAVTRSFSTSTQATFLLLLHISRSISWSNFIITSPLLWRISTMRRMSTSSAHLHIVGASTQRPSSSSSFNPIYGASPTWFDYTTRRQRQNFSDAGYCLHRLDTTVHLSRCHTHIGASLHRHITHTTIRSELEQELRTFLYSGSSWIDQSHERANCVQIWCHFN